MAACTKARVLDALDKLKEEERTAPQASLAVTFVAFADCSSKWTTAERFALRA